VATLSRRARFTIHVSDQNAMTDPDDRGVRIQLLVASQHPRSRVQPLIGTRGVHFQLGRQPRSELIGPVRATTSQLHRRLLAHFRTDRV
jgi:hypothetical protein